jgi:hypothetical protein
VNPFNGIERLAEGRLRGGLWRTLLEELIWRRLVEEESGAVKARQWILRVAKIA